MRFSGQIAAITGAGSGIGRALAVALAKEGCHLALADLDEAGLQGTVDIVKGHNISCRHVLLDVSDEAAVQKWSDDTVEEFGRVDYIFNNAGVALFDSAESEDYESFRWVMDINFWGMVYGTKAFLKHFRKSGSGHVINVSSLFGLIGFPGQSAYNASKFAIRGYTEALALELQGSNIGVTSVHPGGIRTDIARNARFKRAGESSNSQLETIKRFDALAKTSPAQAAETILNGVVSNKRRVLIGNDARILDFVQRLMPTRYGSFLNRVLS
ncbi:SDR family NAD(P)-dependent oxidoreductase [Sneathiella glossodoripedis]|uniref:SDR family NAD(P)-dependent oxidoreductase n=1 Tax=Sneathiella glossodoripedis TaxID=418853 RepID=UPI00046FB0DA|nr:SDR family oxidoreductase [Sneathiella glossodoripedis]